MCDTVTGVRAATSHPRWLGLYAVTLPQLATLAAVEVAGPPSAVRALVRCVLALGIFVGMGWWVWTSRAALDLEQWCECASRTVTVRVIESRRPELPVPIMARMSMSSEADQDVLVRF
jgi:hypothetical protein